MSGALTVLTDTEILRSITNISEWLQLYGHNSSPEKAKKAVLEDLAIGIPGECLFPEFTSENEEASREEEKGILVYTDNRDEKFVWLNGDWYHLEKVLNVPYQKGGWVMTSTLWERLLMLILTQLDYAARESEAEVPYGCCPLSDPAYLLWQNNRPIGMCSLKKKGTSIWGGEDLYVCDTLDTLYVRPPYRRQGHTLSLLYMLTSQLPPGEHLGLSDPVSFNMCKVLLKFIQLYPELRESMWTLDEDGEVSGTVLLMLGSLMVRGVLSTPVSNPQPIHSEREENYQFTSSGTLISNKVLPAKTTSTTLTPSKTPCHVAHVAHVSANQERTEVEDPSMAS